MLVSTTSAANPFLALNLSGTTRQISSSFHLSSIAAGAGKTPDPAAVEALNRLYDLYSKVESTTSRIGAIVGDLKELAQKAVNKLTTNSDRLQLDRTFQAKIDKLKELLARQLDEKNLFDGAFSVDIASTLRDYIFTGADNQPTAREALLTVPELTAEKLLGNAPLSLAAAEDAVKASLSLQGSDGAIGKIREDIDDFKATLDYAKNSIYGRPNDGPSRSEARIAQKAQAAVGAARQDLATIRTAFSQLGELAKKAAEANSSDNQRAELQKEFNSLLGLIDRAATGHKDDAGNNLFGAAQLDLMTPLRLYFIKDPTDPWQPTKAQATLALPDLRAQTLFGGKTMDISSAASAKDTLAILSKSSQRLTFAEKELADFSDALNFALHKMYPDNVSQSLLA